jgi:hypothetical protein
MIFGLSGNKRQARRNVPLKIITLGPPTTMSFWFMKQKAARSPKVDAGPTPGMKRNVETLHRLGCQACPLNHAKIHTPKMGPTLAAQTDVLFLAEAPGKDEDENTGRPLTGPSGRLLRDCLPEGQERRS